jgi:hypothetical protein
MPGLLASRHPRGHTAIPPPSPPTLPGSHMALTRHPWPPLAAFARILWWRSMPTCWVPHRCSSFGSCSPRMLPPPPRGAPPPTRSPRARHPSCPAHIRWMRQRWVGRGWVGGEQGWRLRGWRPSLGGGLLVALDGRRGAVRLCAALPVFLPCSLLAGLLSGYPPSRHWAPTKAAPPPPPSSPPSPPP